MSIQLVTADTVHFDALVNLFNVAYSDYMVPLHLTDVQLRRTIAQNDMDLSASYVAVDGENLVGMGFLAKRDIRGWIGGMGVVPSHRHQGIGRQLMLALLDSARRLHLDTVQLEVIEGNTAAYNLYVSLGFETLRRLLIVQCHDPVQSAGDPSLSIQTVQTQEALNYYEAFHIVPNPWQREYETLRRANDLGAWLARREGIPVAYVIGRMTKHMIQMMDAAFDEGEQAALAALISRLYQLAPDTPASMVNIPDDDAAWSVLLQMRYEETMAQTEMVYHVR